MKLKSMLILGLAIISSNFLLASNAEQQDSLEKRLAQTSDAARSYARGITSTSSVHDTISTAQVLLESQRAQEKVAELYDALVAQGKNPTIGEMDANELYLRILNNLYKCRTQLEQGASKKASSK